MVRIYTSQTGSNSVVAVSEGGCRAAVGLARQRKITSPACFKTNPGLQAPVNPPPPTSPLWGAQVRRAMTFRRGHENRTKTPLTWLRPPPAQHQLTWKREKKIRLIINWDVSVFAASGIWAMHWLFKKSTAISLPPPVPSGLLATHTNFPNLG